MEEEWIVVLADTALEIARYDLKFLEDPRGLWWSGNPYGCQGLMRMRLMLQLFKNYLEDYQPAVIGAIADGLPLQAARVGLRKRRNSREWLQ